MTDPFEATSAHLRVSLPAQGESTPTLGHQRSLSSRIWAFALTAFHRLRPIGLGTLDRDAAIQARSEKFDDPAVRSLVARRRTPDEVRQEFLVRHDGGPRLC